MIRALWRRIRGFRTPSRFIEIYPDEIFLDSSNIPSFDRAQMEGRISPAISRRSVLGLGLMFALIALVFSAELFNLQIRRGEVYATMSEENRLHHTTLFADRGIIYDRKGQELAWNEENPGEPFSKRRYSSLAGIGHLLGYVNYPKRDTSGFFYQSDIIPQGGVEKAYHERLRGEHGIKIVETDALGVQKSESTLRPPASGSTVELSIDATLSDALYRTLRSVARESGFVGGSGVIMDVRTGELLALASFPEFDPQILTDGADSVAIEAYVGSSAKPFLNRASSGLYAPGSIIKPFVAVGALEEGIILPETEILSTGSLRLPNPFRPGEFSIFKDWKAHGYVDMREALAVSSDVYFYEVGGGFEEQEGLGILRLEKYLRLFGFGSTTGASFVPEESGVIPTPLWKEETFNGDPWRLGDTYNTAIGQYGMQVTPLQAVRAVAAIANGGYLVTPVVLLGDIGERKDLGLDPRSVTVAREGMRLAVEEGTGSALNILEIPIAAKTGTAEVGVKKEFVNSWVIGFFPYDKPRFAFAAILERGKAGVGMGAPAAMREFFEWLYAHAPEYLSRGD